MIKILIAEDDVELSQLFKSVLVKQGYEVVCVSNGKEGINAISENFFDLIISDIMMPVMDGYKFVRALREQGFNMPVLMITAKDAFEDMQRGFLFGSDDYMVKPVNVNEMVLRIKALLRRAKIASERKQVIGNTVLDCDSCIVFAEGEEFVLPLKEFMLLYKMASYPGKIFTRQQLLSEIWGYEAEGDTHTVDVHIERLRKKFRDNNDFEIVTIRGIGYKVVKR